jgi:hypothetical protein
VKHIKLLNLLIVFSVILSACVGPTGERTESGLVIAQEEGFGVQDVWMYNRILHVGSDGIPRNIMPTLFDSAELDVSNRTQLPLGMEFTPFLNLPGSVEDGAGESGNIRPSIDLTVGLLEGPGFQNLMIISTADFAVEATNIDLDDYNILDITAFPDLGVEVGDTLIMDLMFAQALAPEDKSIEAGLNNLEVFANRVQNGQLMFLGNEVEDGENLHPSLLTGVEAEVIEGSVKVKTASKLYNVAGAVIGTFVGTLIAGPGALVAAGVAGVFGLATAAGVNLIESVDDDDAPHISVKEHLVSCNPIGDDDNKGPFGFIHLYVNINDLPPGGFDFSSSEGISSYDIDVDDIPLGLQKIKDRVAYRLIRDNEVVVVNILAEIRNYNETEREFFLEIKAIDKKGNRDDFLVEFIVPGSNCIERFVDLQGLVWHDVDFDGKRGEDEITMDDIEVVLFQVDGQDLVEVDRVRTIDGGKYFFPLVPRSTDHIIKVIKPPGWVFSFQDAISLDPFDEIDSDVIPSGALEGYSRIFNLSNRWPKATLVFGLDAGLWEDEDFVPTPSITPTASQTPTPIYSPTVTFTPSQTPTETPTPTATPEPIWGFVDVEKAACRHGPSKNFLDKFTLSSGLHLEIEGRHHGWVLVRPEDHDGKPCWISGNLIRYENEAGEEIPNGEVLNSLTEFDYVPFLPNAQSLVSAPSGVVKEKNGNTVKITWQVSGIGGDDNMGYLIAAEICQEGRILWFFVHSSQPSFTFQVDTDCHIGSQVFMYNVHSHGYSQSTRISVP